MERSRSREDWEVGMCLSNAKRACTNVMKVLPRLNEQQCQYLQTELTKAMDNIEEHMQVQGVAAKEFECAVSRAENLLKQCSYENWLLKAVEMGDSGGHFVEVLLDLHLATDLVRWRSQNMELEEMLSSWQRWLEAFEEKEKNLHPRRKVDKSSLLTRVEEVFTSNEPEETKRHLSSLLRNRHHPHFSWHPPDLETYVRNFQLTTREKNVFPFGEIVVVKFSWIGRIFALKMPRPRPRYQVNCDMFRNEADLLQKYGNPYIVGFVGHWKIPVTRNYFGGDSQHSSSSAELVPLLLMENMEITVKELLNKVQGRRHNDMNERGHCKPQKHSREGNSDNFCKQENSFWDRICKKFRSASSGLPSGLSPTEVINLMLPVARALNYLHGKEVAHRDLKPQNIMCTLKCNKFNNPQLLNEVTVKLIDFGEAKELGAHGDTIRKAGTIGYMAPEVHNLTHNAGHTNSSDDIDLLKADIFSFGMVLGEVLTKRPPLEALGSGQPIIFWNKLKEGRRPNIPDHFPLDFITQSCWDANPRHRPQAEDICRMLSHAKLFLSGRNVFSPDQLTKVFSFEDHDGIIRRACI